MEPVGHTTFCVSLDPHSAFIKFYTLRNILPEAIILLLYPSWLYIHVRCCVVLYCVALFVVSCVHHVHV